MKYFSENSFRYFWRRLKIRLDEKFDVAGGEITGNVKIDGSLTLDIEDEDYDSGITMIKSLDNNAGTVLTLTGYANTQQEV